MNERNPIVRAVKQVGDPFELYSHHDLSEAEKGQLEMAEEDVALPPHCNALAWSILFGYREHVRQHADTVKNARLDKLMDFRGAANRGIRELVRYGSFLPLIYSQQRSDFANAPQSARGQLEDLTDIAHRSLEPITQIADRADQIASRVEHALNLCGEYRGNTGYLLTDVNAKYRMRSGQDGLEVYIPELSDCVERVESSFRAEHNDKDPRRKGGCMALRVSAEGADVRVMHTLWGRIVEHMTTDPQFFAASLEKANRTVPKSGSTVPLT